MNAKNAKNLFLPLVLLAAALPLQAADTAGSDATPTLSYDYIDVGVRKIDVSEYEDDADGYSIGLSKSLGDSFFLALTADAVQLKDYYIDLDAQTYSLSLGYHHPLSSSVDLMLAGGPSHLRIQAGGGKGSATGGQAQLGLRAAVTPKLELAVRAQHQRIEGEAGTSFAATARYLLTPNFSLGFSLGAGQNESSYGASVRFQF